MSDPEQLVAQGRLVEAARAFESVSEFDRAAELYEQLWDHAAAARVARAGGDLPRALGNALQARDAASLEALIDEICEETSAAVAAGCAAVAEARGAWAVAARLHRAAGALHESVRCLEQAGLMVEAARCHEELGDLRRAMDIHDRHLSALDDEAAGGSNDRDIAAAALALGRLLLRFGRAEEALPLLQRSRRIDPCLLAGCAVVAALHQLGYPHGARRALDRLRDDLPQEAPADLEGCLGHPDLVAVADSQEDQILAGRYKLGELLGSGGMGRVYQATDRLSEEQVAVKVFTAPGGAKGRDAYRRFMREARTTGQLRHPHIVGLLDFNEEMGFMVLEFMKGGTLVDRLRPGLDLASCRSVMLQIISGLTAAHQRGIIHRDIKPSNIFFSATASAKLGDFGVAHLQDSGQTQTGAFIGTLAFMSPEQIMGDPVTFATDVYSLGVTLYLMMTGQLPFSHPDLVQKHLSAAPARPSSLNSALPVMCDEVILRCLAKGPADRYESLDDMRAAVEQLPAAAIEGRAEAADPPPSRQAAPPPPRRRSSDQRYAIESTLCQDATGQLFLAHDRNLGRAVVLVRIAPGPHRQRLMGILAAAAAGGGEHLQRVLSLDLDLGQATLETRMGGEMPLPPRSRRQALLSAWQVGSALAPLHRAGWGHGAITPRALRAAGDIAILSLSDALLTVQDPRAPGDISALIELLGLEAAAEAEDGAQLVDWARQELERHLAQEQVGRLDRLVRRAVASAPPEISRE